MLGLNFKSKKMLALPALICLFLFFSAHKCSNNGGGSVGPPPPPNHPPERLTVEELSERQKFAANNSCFMMSFFDDAAPLYVAKNIANGGSEPNMTVLPVSYWRAGMAYALHLRGVPGGEEWMAQWLRNMFTEGRGDQPPGPDNPGYASTPIGSMNHQMARNFGIYWAIRVLGEDRAMGIAGNRYRSCVDHNKDMVQQLLSGRWQDSCQPWSQNAQAGDDAEIYRSRHYGPRDIEYLWEMADMGDEPEATLAKEQMDKFIANLLPGIKDSGVWDEAVLPRFRADKDSMIFPETWRPFGLTCFPAQTPVMSYILFNHTEWRPEFQCKSIPHGEDTSIEQWAAYPFIGGQDIAGHTGWRPKRNDPV